jgi:hypothetical protein
LSAKAVNCSATIGATVITATTNATITSVTTVSAETARPMPSRSARRAIGSSR